MKQLKVLFYKSEGRLLDRAIRKWTGGPYSHSEIWFSEEELMYSSSGRDGGVRKKSTQNLNLKHWDIINIDIPDDKVESVREFLERELNKPYDYVGIFLSQVLSFSVHDPKKWFCSEICYAALCEAIPELKKLGPAQDISPNKLYSLLILTNNNNVKKTRIH